MLNYQKEDVMGISLITALVIQTRGDDIRCEAVRDNKTGRWSGHVNLYRKGCFHATQLSSEPVFKSSKAAVEAMENAVKQVRAMKLA